MNDIPKNKKETVITIKHTDKIAIIIEKWKLKSQKIKEEVKNSLLAKKILNQK